MQDKDLHIDKKFTDRAWAEMHRMLDAEMPAVERRRRFGWWWVLLGLAAFLGIGIAAVWHFSKNQPQPPVKVEQPVASENSTLDKTNSIEPQALLNGKTDDGANIASNSTTPTEPANEQQQKSFSSKTEVPITAIETVFKKENEFTSQILDYQSEKESLATIEANDENLKKAGVAETQDDRQLLFAEKIPSLKLSSIDHSTAFDSKLDGRFSKKNTPIELSAYVGGYATPLNKTNGLDAGISVGLPLGKSRFSFESGPEYAFVQQPLYVVVSQNANPLTNPSVSNTEEVFVSISDADNKLDSSPGYYGSVTKVSESLQMHYANLPLSIKFKATPRFSFHSGVTMGLLLASSPGYTGGGVLKIGADQNIAEEYNLDAETSSIVLSKFDLAATGGIGYQLNYRLALDFQYKFGVRDLITSNSQKEYNRFFNLSLRYRILGKSNLQR